MKLTKEMPSTYFCTTGTCMFLKYFLFVFFFFFLQAGHLTFPRMTSHVNLKRCCKCHGDTEFYCHDCSLDLCYNCQVSHITDLDTKHHYVTLYREKIKTIKSQERCSEHQDQFYDHACKNCDVPLCPACSEHSNHEHVDITTAYERKRKEQQLNFIKLKCETIYNAQAMFAGLKNDVRTDVINCHKEVGFCLSTIKTRRQKQREFFESNEMQHKIRKHYHKQAERKFHQHIAKQRTKVHKNIKKINKFENNFDKFSKSPTKFLKFIKNYKFDKIHRNPKVAKRCFLFLKKDNDWKELIKILCKIRKSKRQKRHTRMENLLNIVSPVIQTYINMTEMDCCKHISCVNSDRVWVSSDYDLILTNKTNEILHHVSDWLAVWSGSHTVNRESGDLIYIANDYKIKTVSSDTKKSTTLIERADDSHWKPLCLYCSQLTGDILVAMKQNGSDTCKIVLYGKQGTKPYTVQNEITGKDFYKNPLFITENTNRNVVVSDSECRAVVVTDYEGIHRFTYKGPSEESQLDPRGICTDALSNILVCDIITEAVQMIDKNGQFLSNILTGSRGITEPVSLSYDANSHFVFVGSKENNTISVYRYMNRYIDWRETNVFDGDNKNHDNDASSYEQTMDWEDLRHYKKHVQRSSYKEVYDYLERNSQVDGEDESSEENNWNTDKEDQDDISTWYDSEDIIDSDSYDDEDSDKLKIDYDFFSDGEYHYISDDNTNQPDIEDNEAYDSYDNDENQLFEDADDDENDSVRNDENQDIWDNNSFSDVENLEIEDLSNDECNSYDEDQYTEIDENKSYNSDEDFL